MENKKRKLALGITFLLSSGLVYFLFLISWLNLATLLNDIIYITKWFLMLGVTIVDILFCFAVDSYSIWGDFE